MRTHQCGNASVLKLEYKEAFLEYRLVEDQVKRFLTKRGCHIHGEWFLLVDGITDYKEIIELSRTAPDTTVIEMHVEDIGTAEEEITTTWSWAMDEHHSKTAKRQTARDGDITSRKKQKKKG